MELNLSIGKVLLLTYIIIASSYCSNLFSNGLKKAIETNRFVQHMILILLIMSLMILFGNPFGVQISSSHTINIVIITLLIYVWFILTTKLDLAWNIGVIILLVIYFLFESKTSIDLGIQLKDTNIPLNTKSELVQTFITNNNIVLVGIFGITLIGSLFYTNEKQVQYGGGFSLTNFWFN
jgi:hypothetical protein